MENQQELLCQLQVIDPECFSVGSYYKKNETDRTEYTV